MVKEFSVIDRQVRLMAGRSCGFVFCSLFCMLCVVRCGILFMMRCVHYVVIQYDVTCTVLVHCAVPHCNVMICDPSVSMSYDVLNISLVKLMR